MIFDGPASFVISRFDCTRLLMLVCVCRQELSMTLRGSTFRNNRTKPRKAWGSLNSNLELLIINDG